MNNELIIVRQLPVIEDQLRTVRENIEAYVASVLAMDCTEETYKAVKKARSELNAQFKELEQRRKEVKAQVEAPYKQFEQVYKICAGDIFTAADKELAKKIADVENGIKQQKRDKVRAYFEEYRESLGISLELVTFDRAGINVTMSASEKSLKSQAKAFLDRIKDDLALIDTQEHKHEIFVEYKKSLNASHAIMAVTNRHAEIARQEALLKQWEDADRAAKETAQKVEEAIPVPAPIRVVEPTAPVQIPTEAPLPEVEEKIFPSYFCVKATIPKLKALKKFLVDGGYDYASIPAPGTDPAGT